MKYKVGDTVLVKSKEWWDSLPKDRNGNYQGPEGLLFNKKMAKYLGQTHTIVNELHYSETYKLKGIEWSWADWMFEEPTIEDVGFEEIPDTPSPKDPYDWLS